MSNTAKFIVSAPAIEKYLRHKAGCDVLDTTRPSRLAMDEYKSCTCGLMDALADLRLRAQRIEALEAENKTRLDEVEHWVTRYNELDKWRIQTAKRVTELEAQLQISAQRLQELIAQWRERADGDIVTATEFDRTGDQSGNSFAFIKAARMRRECADELAALLIGGEGGAK